MQSTPRVASEPTGLIHERVDRDRPLHPCAVTIVPSENEAGVLAKSDAGSGRFPPAAHRSSPHRSSRATSGRLATSVVRRSAAPARDSHERPAHLLAPRRARPMTETHVHTAASVKRAETTSSIGAGVLGAASSACGCSPSKWHGLARAACPPVAIARAAPAAAVER